MVTVPTGAPLAQNPGSTTKNGNEAGWQPRAFIHPGLVFCPVCLLGLPFEVLSAEGCQPGCLREAGVAQPGEVVCVVDGSSALRGRHAPLEPRNRAYRVRRRHLSQLTPHFVNPLGCISFVWARHTCPLPSRAQSGFTVHPLLSCLCYHDRNLHTTP